MQALDILSNSYFYWCKFGSLIAYYRHNWYTFPICIIDISFSFNLKLLMVSSDERTLVYNHPRTVSPQRRAYCTGKSHKSQKYQKFTNLSFPVMCYELQFPFPPVSVLIPGAFLPANSSTSKVGLSFRFDFNNSPPASERGPGSLLPSSTECQYQLAQCRDDSTECTDFACPANRQVVVCCFFVPSFIATTLPENAIPAEHSRCITEPLQVCPEPDTGHTGHRLMG